MVGGKELGKRKIKRLVGQRMESMISRKKIRGKKTYEEVMS